MSDLLDALKRFKTSRQTSPPPECQTPAPSEGSEVSEVSEDSEVSKLVVFYKSIYDRGALSDPTTKAIRDVFTAHWDRLDEAKRKVLVDRLLEMKLLPEIIGRALILFKGKMTRLM